MPTTGTRSATRRVPVFWPLVAAVLLAAGGWWVYDSIATSLREQVGSRLLADLQTTARSVHHWTETQRTFASSIATDPRFRDDLLAAVGDGDEAADPRKRLTERLGAHVRRLGFEGFVVANTDGDNIVVLRAGDGRTLAEHGDAFNRALKGQAGVGQPFLDTMLKDDRGAPQPSQFAVAPVVAPDGTVGGVLGLRSDPRKSFVRPFVAGRSGRSRETYAFDTGGRLLSPSRFEPELIAAGLMSPAGSSMLHTFVRDPGTSILGRTVRRDAWEAFPLTEMTAKAIAGHPGMDIDGYNGYLGSPVLGAWTWLEEPGVGIAVEVARADAYATLIILQRASWALLLVALVAGLAGAVAARRTVALQKKIRDAERAVKQLGQYSLVKKIGEGGMGEVYFARHAMLRRPCAIKLLRPDKTSEQTIERFEREVQQTSRLTHANTIQIYDYGRTPGGTFYYVMEYLVGVALDEFVEHEGPLPEGRVIYILKQICQSLNEAHRLGLVHRDVKPANIALCKTGGAFDVVKVLDFGLVMDRKSIASTGGTAVAGAITGTPAYLSPEAITNPSAVDGRSDLYAVGAVGYYLLTGKQVFEAESVLDVVNKQLREAPIPPSEQTDNPISHDLEKAILACLEKIPAKRPKDANALARELEWCMSAGDWNRDKARHWWGERESRLEKLYGLSSKETLSPGGRTATLDIDLRGRNLD